MAEQNPFELQIEKETYNIRIVYAEANKQITITVLEKSAKDIYQKCFCQDNLPFEIDFYQHIDYVFIALQRDQSLSYCFKQKCLKLTDLIDRKPRKMKVFLDKKQLTLQEKLALEKAEQQQYWQLKQLYKQAKANIETLKLKLKESEDELQLKQQEIRLQKLKFQETKQYNQMLKHQCFTYKRYFADNPLKEYDFLTKRRKAEDGRYSQLADHTSNVNNSNSDHLVKYLQTVDLESHYNDSQSSDIVQIDQAQFSSGLNAPNR